jgi:ribonuclease VapC
MFIDASAIVAILFKEEGRTDLVERIDAATRRQSSVVALVEAVLGVSKRFGINGAGYAIERYLEASGTEIRADDKGLLRPLMVAHRTCDKGTGHPARLNMGDCYSYALAEASGFSLLHKGDDFARTDLA